MNIGNLLKIAYSSIMRNKTRTLLTILGVVIEAISLFARPGDQGVRDRSVSESASEAPGRGTGAE